jgi:hypothetical protein
MMSGKQIDLPDSPKPGTKAFWIAEAFKMRAERDVLIAARNAAAAVPPKQYLKLKEAAGKAAVKYQSAWSWHIKGQIDSYTVPETSVIMAELGDLIARATRTGRHAKPPQKSAEIDNDTSGQIAPIKS